MTESLTPEWNLHAPDSRLDQAIAGWNVGEAVRYLAGLVALLLAGALTAGERGRPLVEVFNAQEIGGGHINESLIELPDGRIAAANIGGVLLYDGARWRMFDHPDMLGGMRQLALAPDGRLYTGYNGDIGFFADDGSGGLAWHSLRQRVPEADRNFGASIRVHYDATRRGIWFVCSNRLFFLPLGGGEIEVHATQGSNAFGGLVGDDYWVQETGGGLLRVAGLAPLRLEPVANRATLVEGQYIRAIVPDGDEWKVAMANGRLYRYRAGEFLPWAEALWPMLARSHVFCLLRFDDGRFALGAGEHGPLILDAEGRILDRFDRDDGVPANPTLGMARDRLGGLWLAQERTLTRIDLERGVSVYDQDRGLPAAGAAARWRGELYAASGRGVYRLVAGEGAGGGRFERVLPHMRNVRSIAVLDEDALLLPGSGVHVVTQDAAGELRDHVVLQAPSVVNLISSRFVPGRVWVLLMNSVARIDRNRAGELEVTTLTGLDWPVHTLVEQDAEQLWLADRAGGLWRVSVSEAHPPQHLGADDGVPSGTIRLYPRRDNSAWFATNLGLRVFNRATSRLEPPIGVPAEVLDRRIFSLLEDHEGNLWVRGDNLTDVALKQGSAYTWDRNSLLAVSDGPTVFGFLREESVVWVMRADGLVRIDLAQRRDLPPTVLPLLVGVEDLGAKQSLRFDALPSLPASVRSLRVNLALPSTFRAGENRYRSRLSGIDQDWTRWSGESRRDFTNLPDGALRFELEARDAFGRVSVIPVLELGIAAPWWRTTWAYGLYMLAAALALWWSARLGASRRQLSMQARQRELEAEVSQRTEELRQRNAQLAEQAERLSEVDRLKTRFFINVGHEFRTPLTLVLGPIDDLLRDTRERLSLRAREQLEMANRNARRVLDLIVELLDVNRFEHGQMRLTRVPTDLGLLAQRVLTDAAPLLARHGHSSALDVAEGESFLAAIDPPQIERCLSNLIANAAKYMARGGTIELGLRRSGESIELALSDQGRGISAAALPHVFDRFFQAEGADSASGYGIGLALVREIVEAHQGQVEVQSELGVGSTFLLRLPALAESQQAAQVVIAPTLTEDDAPAAVEATASPGQQRERPLLLVVDDHDDLRARVRGLLQDRFDVIEAADGPSAWNLARDRLPDLIVCDVMMPGFDGTELSRRLRADADTAAIAVLLLTAKVGSEHAVAGLQAGADDYLAKPFDASELLARIDALLARAQRLRQRLARERLAPPAPPAAESGEQRWRRRLDEVIAARLDDPDLSVEQLAEQMHADRSQLYRKCKELLGVSPSDYLRDTRLKRAHELLEERAGNVSEIAYAVGFDSLSSFTRAFRTRYGLPPSHVAARKAG